MANMKSYRAPTRRVTKANVEPVLGRVRLIGRLARNKSWAERRDRWKAGRSLNPPTLRLVEPETYEEAERFQKEVEQDLAWAFSGANANADRGCE